MSTSGSKSNEHVAHFLVDIHSLEIKKEYRFSSIPNSICYLTVFM